MLEFPLQPDEVLSAIDQAIEDRASRQIIGDIDVVALHAIRRLLVDRPFVVEDVCAKDRELYKL